MKLAVSFGTGPAWPSKGMRETAVMDPELYSSQTQATRQPKESKYSTIRRSLTFSQPTVYDWSYQLEAEAPNFVLLREQRHLVHGLIIMTVQYARPASTYRVALWTVSIESTSNVTGFEFKNGPHKRWKKPHCYILLLRPENGSLQRL
jgi:hypothetical protein